MEINRVLLKEALIKFSLPNDEKTIDRVIQILPSKNRDALTQEDIDMGFDYHTLDDIKLRLLTSDPEELKKFTTKMDSVLKNIKIV